MASELQIDIKYFVLSYLTHKKKKRKVIAYVLNALLIVPRSIITNVSVIQKIPSWAISGVHPADLTQPNSPV